MNWSRRRGLAAGAAVLVLAGGAGAAYATNQTGSKPSSSKADTPFLTGVANRLHVAPTDLLNAFKAEATARVDAAVSAGRIPAAVGERIKQRIASATIERPLGLLGPRHQRARPLRGIAKAAADYIGVTVAQLRTELRSGKSLAQSAKDHGKTVDGLKTAIYNAAKAKLDKAVEAGKLTKDREQQALDRLKSKLDDIVNRTGPPPKR
jgi:hypothetical protein